ncbi:mitochondrial import inner membrane translocase subunit Tim21 [Dermatophagoides pteronyssinus]|uniref:Mitochondrial import inner membrane translocase subunit Tim21 n=2 Tax=Dermatophagoides pteronyssinus TaxID=6956 RepID=A0A6P6YKL6_DERPT|nr:mitochondrial import inner membrane translocase subunit Tim21-like [Dermatophagoides pteronyssinus]KAH9420855.1 Mitochondrial import inner membrane translocase subunit Tim21 [Dermatophagoides pteronyssinus]
MAFIPCRKHMSYWLSRFIENHTISSSTKLINGNNRIVLFSIGDHFSSSTNDSKSRIATINSKRRNELSKDVKITERIKQTTKDGMNITVVVLGIGIFGFVIYSIFKEFFSSKSPTSIFACALKKCKNDPRITELLGEPIKGHGEITSRRRARHVTSVEYEKNGQTFIRVRFYLKGSRNTATVECETTKNSPRSHFRYLFVQTDSYPPEMIVIEDNRLLDDQL